MTVTPNEDLTDANATLQAANTAINSLRAKYEQQQSEIAEQQRQDAQQHAQQEARADKLTQAILALLGVALAVGQIIGHDKDLMLTRAVAIGIVTLIGLFILWQKQKRW